MEGSVIRAGEGERLAAGPTAVELKATSETTGGAFSIAEVTVAPGFPGPPPHTHRELTDSFYVLEGTLTVRVGDETMEAGPGAYVCATPGTVHTFSNPGDSPVRFLNINSPAGWENYLRELMAAMGDGPPEPAQMAEIASRYDFEPAPE